MAVGAEQEEATTRCGSREKHASAQARDTMIQICSSLFELNLTVASATSQLATTQPEKS